MSEVESSLLRRHPVVALLVLNGILFVGLAVVAEVFLRVFVSYNPGYYVSVGGTDRLIEYPYGVIKINSHGFPDDEFGLNKAVRIGYFGDSVTYGVGAGHGYRFSELLEEAYPQFEHLNLGVVGLSVSERETRKALELVEEFGLTHAVYFLNLNDILPDDLLRVEKKPSAVAVREDLVTKLDWLRGKSYLYTWVRTTVRNFVAARGIGFHGYSAYEMKPIENEDVFRQTAGRVNAFADALVDAGVQTTIVILPYEMQISAEAAEQYGSLGVTWEDGFLAGSAQRVLMQFLDPDLPLIDLYAAFVDPADIERSRAENGLGEFFVYNKGDKLDWNHPNRDGHRAIADFLVEERAFDDAAPLEAAESQ